jgi:hypothetical protein
MMMVGYIMFLASKTPKVRYGVSCFVSNDFDRANTIARRLLS